MPLRTTAEELLDDAEKTREVFDLRRDGLDAVEIAVRLGCGVQHVHRIMRTAVDRMRADEQTLIRERFFTHDARLEWLYKRLVEQINASPCFDEKLVRAAVTVLDRQARLLGLDRAKIQQVPESQAWLDKATPEELVRMAEERGLKLPEKFRLPTGAA